MLRIEELHQHIRRTEIVMHDDNVVRQPASPANLMQITHNACILAFRKGSS